MGGRCQPRCGDVAAGDKFGAKNDISHFPETLDRVKLGLKKADRSGHFHGLSTIRRLQFSTISPVHFSNPSVKGLRPDFTTKADCAVHLLIYRSGLFLDLAITE
jgi:hypothetical protein